MTHRILVGVSHPGIRRHLRGILERQQWELCGEATSSAEVVRMTLELAPNLLILDLDMPDGGAVPSLREIAGAKLKVKILMLTLLDSDEARRELFESGAHGYLLKTVPEDDVVSAIQQLLGEV